MKEHVARPEKNLQVVVGRKGKFDAESTRLTEFGITPQQVIAPLPTGSVAEIVHRNGITLAVSTEGKVCWKRTSAAGVVTISACHHITFHSKLPTQLGHPNFCLLLLQVYALSSVVGGLEAHGLIADAADWTCIGMPEEEFVTSVSVSPSGQRILIFTKSGKTFAAGSREWTGE